MNTILVYITLYQHVKGLHNHRFLRDCMSKVRDKKNTDRIKFHRCKVYESCT